MKLEALANELLLDLFEYFNSVHLILGFYGLNIRFNNLLYTHFRSYSLDFRSVSKHNFEIIYNQHLSSIADRILFLRLSNDDETPVLAEYFLFRAFILKQFTYLQLLSLHHINSLHTLNRIIFQCRYLLYFTHLNIIECHFSWKDKYAFCLINNIWSLSKLKYLKLNGFFCGELEFTNIQVVSLSIEYLSINKCSWNLYGLSHLFEYTPCLHHLSTIKIIDSNINYLNTAIPLMTELKFLLKNCFTPMINLLSNMPNLSHLTIETSKVHLDGYQWENIIVQHVPNIKIFQLNMNFIFDISTDKLEQVDKLLDSFRTPFWIKEHHWFVQCDWNPSYNEGCLYTLPYAFEEYAYNDNMCFKSTYPYDFDCLLYKHVNTLKYKILSFNSTTDFSLLSSKLPNVRHLDLSSLFNKISWLRVSTFRHLTSLNISPFMSHNNSFYSLIQTLLDLSPCLYSLTVSQTFFRGPMLNQMTSMSIRRLEFIYSATMNSEFLTAEECLILASSPLGQQCQVLKLGVENIESIFQLIETMFNLRSLTVRCKGDIWRYNEMRLLRLDQLLKWLQSCLPTTYSITRAPMCPYDIRLWIR